MLRRVLILLCAALALATPAEAAQVIVKLTLVPGKLVVKAPAARASAGAPVQVPVTVADGRGSGAGWTLKVAAARAVSISGVSVKCGPSSTCTLPEVVQGPAGSIVLRAARNTGMGVIDVAVKIAPLPAGTPPTPLSFRAS